MVQRLINLVRRLPIDEITRGALIETLADGWHERRYWATIGALARIAIAAADIFDLEHPMRQLIADVRYAVRRLRQSPAFVTFSILTLALGIGAVVAIYAMVHAALSPDRGYAHHDRLVLINHSRTGPLTLLSWGDYLDFRARQTSFEHVSASRFEPVAIVGASAAETASGEFVTGNTFETLGITMSLGRPIQPADDRPDASPVVVLSHRTWRRLFAGAPDVVGTTTTINGRLFEIVGVAAANVNSIRSGLTPVLAWLPMSAMALAGAPTSVDGFDVNDRSGRWAQVVGRLAPGRSLQDARAEVSLIAKQLDLESPIGRDLPASRRVPGEISRPWDARPMADVVFNAQGDELLWPTAATLLSVVGLVFLVACTNLANMMLARSTARQHELAVRRALGASRWRLIRDILLESALVAGSGAVAGMAIARFGIWLVGYEVAITNSLALQFSPSINVPVAAVAALATMLAMLVAGLVPAFLATRQDVRGVLVADAAHGGVPRWRGRRTLIAAQVTVSIMLTALAALCVFQVRATRAFDRGLDLDRLAVASVDFAIQQYDAQRAIDVASAAAREIARRPGVESVAVSSGWPLLIANPNASIRALTDALAVPGHPNGVHASMVAATPSIFHTLGVTLTSGRLFDDQDAGNPSVIVVSENVVKKVFGDRPAVGQQLRFQRARHLGEPAQPETVKTVIGVVTDANPSADRDGHAAYVPLQQHPERILAITARVTSDPISMLSPMRAVLTSIDPGAAIARMDTGDSLTRFDVLFLRIVGGLALVLGAIALVLALGGLYGVLSHLIGRRTREIGVRIALGADRGGILQMVLRDGLSPVITGIVLGLVLAAIARLSLSPLFSRLAPAMDPWILVAVPLAMIAAGALACYLPARRAASIDPNVALRD